MKKRNLLAFFVFLSLFCYRQALGQIITTIAGNGTYGYSGDGAAGTAAQLYSPIGVAVDASGNVYIAEYFNHRVRKVNTLGIITTIAGNGVPSYYGDGAAATAAGLNFPIGVAVDASGNVYIADAANNRIRKVNTSGIITTIAGIGTAGYSGDGAAATAAQLNNPQGVAVDAAGNLYIGEFSNHTIRKVNTSGIITTIAGTGAAGYSGDGGVATAAQLRFPSRVAVDASGNVYIADCDNGRIRKVNTSGIITTIAGTGNQGYAGDGGAATSAELNQPYGIAVDAAGNLYIAVRSNARIRKVDTLGIITTIAGIGINGYSGDGGAATAARLSNPSGVAIDASGNVYIADRDNNVIRKVAGTSTSIPTLKPTDVNIYPNPASDIVYISAPGKVNYTICSIDGKLVQSGKNVTSANIEQLTNGLYLMTITDSDGNVVKVEKLAKMSGY